MSNRPQVIDVPNAVEVVDIQSAREAIRRLAKSMQDLNKWAGEDNYQAGLPTIEAVMGVERTTGDGVATELTLNGDAPSDTTRLLIPNDTVWLVHVSVVGSIAGVGTVGTFDRKCTISNADGTVALVGGIDTIGTDQNGGGWGGVTPQADNTNDSLQIMATGAAATTIHWVAKVTITELTFED